jgi:hypothetical protein
VADALLASGPDVCGRGSEFIAADGEMRFVRIAEGDGAVVLALLLFPPAEAGVAGPPPLPGFIDGGALGAFAPVDAPAPLPEVGRMLGDATAAPSWRPPAGEGAVCSLDVTPVFPGALAGWAGGGIIPAPFWTFAFSARCAGDGGGIMLPGLPCWGGLFPTAVAPPGPPLAASWASDEGEGLGLAGF